MSDVAWPLFGHARAEEQFLQAARAGKLHHAWLIEGPSAIGKSRLAIRIAAYMLGAEPLSSNSLDLPSDDPVVQKLTAEAHPDLRWVDRRPDDKGKTKQDIPVDAIRSLKQFFALKSAMRGWRVGVIDSLDELNRNGANAMLKMLEEPPSNALLLLVSHGTRSLLPTIRSRCRTLRLDRLSNDETFEALKLAGASDPRAAAKLARGRPGLGLSLTSPSGMTSANAARSWLRGLPKPTDSSLAQLLQVAGADAVAFEAFSGEIMAWLAESAETNPNMPKAWLSSAQLLSEVRSLNMDRSQAAAKIIEGVQTAVQSG